MLGRVRLFDYRCFHREQPATIELNPGFTSLIGPNNSGKSSFMRSLYELRSAFEYAWSGLSNNSMQFLLNPIGWSLVPPLHEHEEVLTDRDGPQCRIELEPALPQHLIDSAIARLSMEAVSNGSAFKCRLFASDGEEIGVPDSPTALASATSEKVTLRSGKVYSLRPLLSFLEILRRAQYVGPFRNAINEGAGGHFDTQIGTGFINQWHQWKTGANKKNNRAIERVTDDVRRLLGARTLEIMASNELKTLQVVVDRRPFKLPELGAGFSQLVLVLGSALIRGPSFILIDEPELHLHPALQNDFLTTLAGYAEHGIFYTTHSMGLARLADRCLSVQKRDDRSIVRPFDRTPNYAEFLGSLGIAGLQDLGWDRVLLVEGPKDVRTAQQLLRLYDKDRNTIVLPLGGDSMINGKITHELSEVRRLCERVHALVDSERAAGTDAPMQARSEFARICAQLSIRCCVTDRRAIENYVSQGALDRTWGSARYKALDRFTTPPSDGTFWGKGETWRAAQNMTRSELEATDLGQFLAEL